MDTFWSVSVSVETKHILRPLWLINPEFQIIDGLIALKYWHRLRQMCLLRKWEVEYLTNQGEARKKKGLRGESYPFFSLWKVSRGFPSSRFVYHEVITAWRATVAMQIFFNAPEQRCKQVRVLELEHCKWIALSPPESVALTRTCIVHSLMTVAQGSANM